MSFDQIILMVALLAVAGILGWGILTMADFALPASHLIDLTLVIARHVGVDETA